MRAPSDEEEAEERLFENKWGLLNRNWILINPIRDSVPEVSSWLSHEETSDDERVGSHHTLGYRTNADQWSVSMQARITWSSCPRKPLTGFFYFRFVSDQFSSVVQLQIKFQNKTWLIWNYLIELFTFVRKNGLSQGKWYEYTMVYISNYDSVFNVHRRLIEF